MRQEKIKILETVKDLTSQQVDDLIKNTEKLWSYLNTDEPLYSVKKQEVTKPVIEIINEKVDSDKTLTDPLKKEYTKHMLISNFIESQLEKGLKKLCLEIDEKLGVKNVCYTEFADKLQELYMKGLVPYGAKDCVFSSGDYNSESVDSESEKVNLEKINSEKIILTGRENIDKNIVKELIENKEPLFTNCEKQKNLFKKFPFGKVAKDNYYKIPNISEEKILSISEERIKRFKEIEKNVKDFFENLDKNITLDEQAI